MKEDILQWTINKIAIGITLAAAAFTMFDTKMDALNRHEQLEKKTEAIYSATLSEIKNRLDRMENKIDKMDEWQRNRR